MELVGEKDERVYELEQDLEDLKQVYREQVDFLTNQLLQQQ